MRKIHYAKVFFNGVEMNKIAVGVTWFERFMYKLTLWARRTMIVAFIVGLVYGSFQLGRMTSNPSSTFAASTEVDVSDTRYQAKIDSLKNQVVEDLRKCERAHYTESDGVIIYDPLVSNPSKTAKRDVPSIGTLQFKQSTVQYYYKKLYGKEITLKDSAIIALDDAKSGQLAKDIIFKEKGGYTNWKNCANSLSLSSRIETIKSLE